MYNARATDSDIAKYLQKIKKNNGNQILLVMNILNQKIRLSFGQPKYFFSKSSKTGQEIVVCQLPVYSKTPEIEIPKSVYELKSIRDFRRTRFDLSFLLPESFIMKAKATVSQHDVYSKEKGMKIALAKAESAAYSQCASILNENCAKLAGCLCESREDFRNKANRVVCHNSEYINKLAK